MLHSNMVTGYDAGKPKDEPCENCLMGKHTRLPLPKNEKKVKSDGILKIIHSDVCEPMEVKSKGKLKF